MRCRIFHGLHCASSIPRKRSGQAARLKGPKVPHLRITVIEDLLLRLLPVAHRVITSSAKQLDGRLSATLFDNANLGRSVFHLCPELFFSSSFLSTRRIDQWHAAVGRSSLSTKSSFNVLANCYLFSEVLDGGRLWACRILHTRRVAVLKAGLRVKVHGIKN
ncbi:hypothetical protein CPC08DRAFT_161812 [Agrocybe pediades]|nr:hypothetical protein CPC08DRAFT_161812 [Agrocybe pediades]